MITAPEPCPFPDRDLERPSNRPNIAAADTNHTSQAKSPGPGIGPLYRFSSVGLLPKHPSLIFLFIISGDNDAILRQVLSPLHR